MTRLVWGLPEHKKYEHGVDHGVLYPLEGPGVVWNGLVSVEEAFEGGELSSYHFDGNKFLDVASPRNFQATITAFSAPEQFGLCLGERPVIPGFVLTRQARVRFGMSYRTLVGGTKGYKLHLIYNALASPTGRNHSTLSESASAEPRSWRLDAVPLPQSTYRPTAHFVIDSTKTNADALHILETILYGSDEENPRLPDIDELLDIVAFWSPLRIFAQPVTGLAELQPATGDLYRTKVDGYLRALPNSRLYKSSTNGLYRLE